MAATGGGKIRSRRYHIASKPYAKSKQQPSGLISRVTDTVKSIVPSWLQKYFRNGDAADGGGVMAEAEQNSRAPPPNGSEEVAPLPDGRDSPEPGPSYTEPSTSRASLNFQDVLSRPPLNRSHLHFPSLDASSPLAGSSSMFPQPSTSSAPFSAGAFAGASSGFSLVKEIKDNSSQHEDDNISTTSGFSSRASEKDVPNSKTASLPQLWSPETERPHSGPQQSQSGLKKPTFNLSVFGSSSTSTMNSSVLNSSQLGGSPFYPGKTTYGGAAAVRTARSRTATPYQAPFRRQIKAKPAGAQPCGVTSATARRILQSLERMSSPLADAKRIPSTSSSPSSSQLDGSATEFSHFQARKKRLDHALPPVQKLVVPSAAAVSGNRSMSFKPSLTPGGLPRTPRETHTGRSPLVPFAGPSQGSSLPLYPLSSTPAPSSTAGGGKMKRERTGGRPPSKQPEDQIVEVPDLPAISLPISTSFTLPAFSFTTSATTVTVTASAAPIAPALEEPVCNKVSPSTAPSTPPSTPFTFSSPIVMATAASPLSFSPSSGFTFSAPVVKTAPTMSNGRTASPKAAAVKHASSESMEEFEGPFKPAKVLKQGSVMDILKGPGFACPVTRTSPVPKAPITPPPLGEMFKAPVGSWDCDVCMLQNKSADSTCVACTAPRPNSKTDSKPLTTSSGLNNAATTTTTASSGFGSLFTKPTGSWDCDTCLVQNKPETVKCVACETAKPGTGVKAPLTLPAFPEAKAAPPAVGPLVGFGAMFKKPEGAWECDVCLVQNKAPDVKCVSCTSAKPGAAAPPQSLTPSSASNAAVLGFGDKFKKPQGAWDCEVCFVQNQGSDRQCVACQSAKPGAEVQTKAFGSTSFGIQSSTDSGTGGFKFGTGAISDSSSGGGGGGGGGGFKFGGALLESSSSGGFKFGVASSDSTSTDNAGSAGFKFSGSSEGFKFGANAASSPAADKGEKAGAPSMGAGFKFGLTGGIAFGAASVETKPAEGGFSFGLSKPEEKTTCTTSTSSTFSLPTSTENHTGAPSEPRTSAASSATPSFGKPTEATPSALAPPLGGSVFVETPEKEQAKPAATPFTFGKPEEKSGSAGSGLLFTAASKEAETSGPSMGFSFSKPDPPKEQPNAPAFAFGKLAEKSEPPAAEAPKPSFSFGQSTTDAVSSKPAFGFLASTATPASSSSTPATSLFGTPGSSSPAPSTFLFGQSSSGEAPPSKTFLFGQSQDSQPGPAATAPVAPAQPFQFGSGTNNATASFPFGAPASSATSTAAPAAAPSLFVFSPASSAGFGPGQAPAFGQGASQPGVPAFGSPAPSPFSNPASQPPTFGAKPNSVPVFGQQANSAPSFGSSAPSAPGAGFQFGAASVFGASSNNTGVFAFGGAAAGSPAPSVTPSMAPQTGAPGGGFNFAAPPNFNIGSAKSTNLTAAPAAQHSIAGRKIKTAVRRKK